MKLKELKRTVNVCWSPAEHYPVTLAAGSAAQQVDSSFSSSSSLELYSLNLEDPGIDLELKASLQTQHKFQKLVWSGAGILVGGCDGGLLQFYSWDRILNNAPDCLMGSCTKHNGNVSALDINPYQKNLLASGASESEIFIWDLNNTSQPMAPGNKSQPYDHVQDLAWNHQVQHILGSTFANRCVVWDLRKNEPIMKLSDSQSRTRWRSLAWHPSVATQVCIASEDDQVPVVQLWDLRLAASPLVTLEGHGKGVMALSWCTQDPDLLLTAGKDGRVLCWNPNDTQPGGSLLCEVSQQQQWVFDVSWSPRDPSLFVASSFDHQLTVYSLLGGSKPETNSHQQSNIMESFGGADSFSQLPAVQRAPPAAPQTQNQLPVAPGWLKRPVRAKFAFGGKLVTFDRCPQENGTSKQVYVSQVVSEPEIVEKASELDAILNSTQSNEPNACERLAEYCRLRGDQATDQQERYTWFFLRANFLQDFRTEALNLLGFKQDEIPSKFKNTNAGDVPQIHSDLAGLSRGESTETEAELSTDTSTDLSEAHTLIERKLGNLDLEPAVTNVVIPNGEDSTSMICRALVCGNFEEAVELCLDAKKITDALVIASLGSPELVSKVQRWYLSRNLSDPVSLVTNALVCGNWSHLIGASGTSWRHVLAALITHSSEQERAHLAESLGNKLSKETDPALSEAATICYLVAMSPEALVQRWNRTRNGDVNSLATLTTLALLARRAALNRGRQIQPGGALEGVVSQYAQRLAAQGCLHSALTAVQGLQQDGLRERLQGALLKQQQQPQQPQQPLQQQPQQPLQQQPYSRTGRRSLARSDIGDHYAPPAPGYEQPWSSSSVPAQNQFTRFQQPPQPTLLQSTPLQPAQMQPGPLQPGPMQPAPIMPPPQAPPTQPARPSSVGPSGGLTSRSKYKVDPSVQAAPSYNQYGYNNPVTSQPQSYGYNSPLPDQYGNSSIPTNAFAPINTYSTNPGLNAGNTVNPGPANPGLNTAVNGNYYNQEPPALSKPVAPGWNDPPMQSSKSKPKQEVSAPAPITHPLFGVEPQHVPLNPTPGQQYAGQQYPGQQYAGQQYAGQQYAGQQYAGQQQYTGQYDQYQNNMISGQQQVEQAAVAEPAAPVPKPPLPEQYVAMQNVFDRIRTECSERANNPQMKRKLEDVTKRLETLYDLLREYKLSENATQSLQSCVQYCQAHDYGSALAALTALATGSDFAAAASFLPGLKMLVQLAHQLQVYIS